jgi:LacI family transcriptional regulator
VALPFDKMGAMGVELLARQSAGEPTTTTTVMVDCPLLERSSV